MDQLLKQVQKPSRYTGGEWGSIKKDLSAIDIRFAFCFPDVYEVGMSHLGMKILYHLMNTRENIWCERVFAPWDDFETLLRQHNKPLYALESGDPICDFDFVGFTLQYEMCYTNVLNMLDLGHIPVKTEDRKEGDPFVCAGGPCAYHAEPLAPFVDFFILGEGEEVNLEVMDAYSEWKRSGGTRTDFLLKIAKIEGIYVPQFYTVTYHEDNTVKEIKPNQEGVPATIKKRIIRDLDKVYYPDNLVVPFSDIVHDRIMLEVFRGCTRGCRFCQAGMIYRPVREKSPEVLTDCADCLMNNTGYEELSLTSLSTGDYSHFADLTDTLLEHAEQNRTNIALPSLRLDSFNLDLINRIQKQRKSSFTFAPEAGTQRMRDVINKNITEEDLLSSVKLAFENGWSGIKLYFMIGLPTETEEDVAAIGELAHLALDQYYTLERGNRPANPRITVSSSSFIPKPFTPFSWEAQDSIETIQQKQKVLGENIHSKTIKYNYHDSKTSRLEGIFARGDRRLSEVLYTAWKKGCKMDGWTEFFKYDTWLEAFEDCHIDPDFYTARTRSYEEVFPWDHIDVGVTKEFLIRESKRAKEAKTTKPCLTACNKCGADCFEAGICMKYKEG
ncbi:MAG: TIGR03960 family B12-binding radical SAM protein [Ruminococcaceae bacterium]|nr:TIGR03960 family B12-binding radical SAM protein [Oscillospiraceae bacterium]